MSTIQQLSNLNTLSTVPKTVFQPTYPQGIDLSDSLTIDYTLPQDVGLFYAVLVTATTTISHVVCYTRNVPYWSVTPETDTSALNGFCLYRKVSEGSLEFVAQTDNSSTFLCNNQEGIVWKHTFDLQETTELIPGTYYVSISTKLASHPNLSHLDDVAYNVSTRDSILTHNEIHGITLIYKYTKPLFLTPPSTIDITEDLEIVQDNQDGHACLLFIDLQ